MSEAEANVRRAVERALSHGLTSVHRQLTQVQNAYEAVSRTLEPGVGDRLDTLLPALLELQMAVAALAATIEAVLRFAGNSMQWTSGVVVSAPGVAPAVMAPPSPAVEEVPAPAEGVVAEVPVEQVEEIVAEVPIEEAAPAEPPVSVEVEAAAPVEEAVPPALRPLSEKEIANLPAELKDLHRKAKRFAKVTVQELMLYKRDEVEKGRASKDLYERLRDEIDKSKALYDKRFAKIAEHNIDYLYEELVQVLGESDPSALANYPYPVPPRG